ncbi:hypothetical protein [Commensalibacter communis]|uniref:hypothetical protein n=1 Tax=Commensalibacter communis TaxID=2972786 RepID=UPI00232D3375|nr:hypothetical protein [Commensalibacter communis]
MKNIIFKFIGSVFRYQLNTYLLIAGIIACVLYPLDIRAQSSLFIGTSNMGSIGYLRIQKKPLNQLYSTLEIKNIHCGAYVSGYTKRQGNQFVIKTDVPDPRKDDLHQCQVTFIQTNQTISIVKEENCNEWHGISCPFTSLQFYSTKNNLPR